MPFILVSCLIALDRTSSTILTRGSKSGLVYFVPDLREKAFSLLTLRLMLTMAFVVFLIRLRNFSFSSLLSTFIMKGCWILSNAFSVSIEVIM